MSEISDSSSFLPQNDNKFTSEIAFKVVMLLIIIFLCFCIFSSMMAQASTCNTREEFDKKVVLSRPNISHIKQIPLKEHFSNDQLFSFNDTPVSRTQTIQLLPPDNKSLITGEVDRFIVPKNDSFNFILNISCNLYVLGGNAFDSNNPITQEYLVYLQDTKANEKMLLGPLKKDGDGLYKLKFQREGPKVRDLVNFNKIIITYKLNNDEQIVLLGTFK